MNKISPRRPAVARTIAEAIAFVQRAPLSQQAVAALSSRLPRGDGRAVLVIPSVFRDDAQTSNLRTLLAQLGYRAFGWELGRNLGPTKELMAGALRRLTELASEHGKMTVIGFSMGGLFARWLAIEAEDRVREIITVGSPIREPLQSAFVPESLLLATWQGQDLQSLSARLGQPVSVPATSLYSRADGIVAWESCYDPASAAQAIEVSCPHVMMPQDEAVFRHIADTLARPKT